MKLKGPPPHRSILDLLRALPDAEAHNRLMRATDKDVAMTMLFMQDYERGTVLRYLSDGKGKRVIEELARNEHVRIVYPQYLVAVEQVRAILAGEKPSGERRPYFRPYRATGRRS